MVDFDRCPQKHCSICAPFWRNVLRILIDLGWWEPSSIQTIGQGYHNTGGSGCIASPASQLLSWRLTQQPSNRRKGTVCRTNYAKTRHLQWSPLSSLPFWPLSTSTAPTVHRRSFAFTAPSSSATAGNARTLQCALNCTPPTPYPLPSASLPAADVTAATEGSGEGGREKRRERARWS